MSWGFKPRPQTWTVGIVNGPTTMIAGIPWTWLNEEKWRLHTFARYPPNAPKSAILLAEDGFAYNGSGVDSDDSVICYFCTGSKRGWREDEIIRETHRDLNPTCPIVSGALCNNVPMAACRNVSFASMGKSLSTFEASQQTNNQYNNPQTAPVNQPNNPQTAPVNQTNTQETTPGNHTNPQNPTYDQLAVITERPKRHEYADRQKRLATFENWPAGHHLKKEDLANAGFYYAGYGDCVRCFCCGGDLSNWEVGDDVWVEHARCYPTCAITGPRFGQITFDMVAEGMRNDPAGATFQIDGKDTHLKNDPAVVTVREMGYRDEDILYAANLHREIGQILSADELFETLKTTGAERQAVQNPIFSSIQPSSDMQKDQECLDTIKKNNREIRLQYSCKACNFREVDIVFLPCRHMVCCTECSSAMRDCPVCRKQVKGVVHGFMA